MAPDTLYVIFNGIINDINATRFVQQVETALNPDIKTVHVLINTPGGHVNSGMFLHSYLSSIPYKVVTQNVGQVDSIGTIMFLAGKERYASTGSTFLFHGVALTSTGPVNIPTALLQERITQLVNDEQRISDVIKSRTAFTPQQLKDFFAVGQSINAKDALKHKVVDGVRDITIPANAPRIIIDTLPIKQ